MAGWCDPEFDWHTLPDIICPVNPTALLITCEYPPELTFEYGFGWEGVPTSACVDAAPKLPGGGTDGCWPSMPSNPKPAFYYSDEKPFPDVTHSQLHQQSGVVYHEANDNTQRAPEMALPDDRSQNPQSQIVPPNRLIKSNQRVTEKTCAVSQKRRRRCKKTVCFDPDDEPNHL